MKKYLNKFYKNSEKIISDSGVGKYKTVQKGGRWIRSLLKSNFVEIEGHKMHLDPLDSLKLSINKSYEEFETKAEAMTRLTQLSNHYPWGRYVIWYARLTDLSTGKVLRTLPGNSYASE